MKRQFALGVVLAAALPVAEAQAQSLQTIRIRPGLGAQVQPKFIGSDETEVGLYPGFAVAFGDEPFGIGAPDDNFSPKLFGSGGLAIGPVAAFEGSRTDAEVGAPVGKVPATFELGAFAEHRFGDFRLHAQARKGIGGHKGTVGHVAADYVIDEGDRYAFTIGPRLLFSDARYQRSWFGVSDEAALATGLESYRPGGGVHAIAATAGGNVAIGGGWGLFGYARYERLVGDAKRSPLIETYGSPSQYSAGIGLSRTFTIKL